VAALDRGGNEPGEGKATSKVRGFFGQTFLLWGTLWAARGDLGKGGGILSLALSGGPGDAAWRAF